MKEDLNAARDGLLLPRNGLSHPTSSDYSSSLLLRIHWGLMVAEKELSCCRSVQVTEQIKHVESAERYSIEAAKAASELPETGVLVQVTLEQYILQGRRAMLRFREGADMDEMDGLKKDAVRGIDRALEGLEGMMDRVRFDENVRLALYWRGRFMGM